MRQTLTLLHRYVGLTIGTALIIAGITGSIIVWDHELDAALNPTLLKTASRGEAISPTRVAQDLEASNPRLRVTYLPIAIEPGATLAVFVQPRIDPRSGQPFDLDFNQVFLDPVTGNELGRREWGRTWPITRATLIPFIYKLHYSLHVPTLWGETRIGLWLMGSVAAVWFVDCFIGLYLTLPRRHRSARAQELLLRSHRSWLARWAPAFEIKTSGSRYRTVFDIHRAFGLWTWFLLLVVSFSGFALALDAEVLRPLLSTIARVTPTPLETKPAPKQDETTPRLDFSTVVGRARSEGDKREISRPLGAISYDPAHEIYSAHYYSDGDESEAITLYIDGRSGDVLGAQTPWSGTTADIVLQAQFPLHSGRILGLAGRILVSSIGLVVAALSATGIIIWWRKRAARVMRQRLHCQDASARRLPAVIGMLQPGDKQMHRPTCGPD